MRKLLYCVFIFRIVYTALTSTVVFWTYFRLMVFPIAILPSVFAFLRYTDRNDEVSKIGFQLCQF